MWNFRREGAAVVTHRRAIVGGLRKEKLKEALTTVLHDKNVKQVLVVPMLPYFWLIFGIRSMALALQVFHVCSTYFLTRRGYHFQEVTTGINFRLFFSLCGII